MIIHSIIYSLKFSNHIFFFIIYRYHREFIEASNEYLKNSINKDQLLVNVIDYFTEKNKPISYEKEQKTKDYDVKWKLEKKKEKIENMKQILNHSQINGKFTFNLNVKKIFF